MMNHSRYHIAPEEFASLCREGKLDGQLIDVREPWEWEMHRLEGARLIPLGSLPERLGEIDRNRKVYLLCAHGIRSLHAAAFLLENGFRDVVNVDGGLAAVSLHLENEETD